MKIVEDGEVPAFMGAKKMSLHQTGFQDVIATAQLMGTCPERLCLIGVQPEELEDYGGGLRDIVAAQIDPSVDIAIDKLAQWDVTAPKAAPPPMTSPITPSAATPTRAAAPAPRRPIATATRVSCPSPRSEG
jgi:hypothetical protein